MKGQSDEPNEFRNAQEAYAAFLREQQAGKVVTFEAFRARHPDLADDLEKLDAGYRLGRSASLSRSFHDSMREHFGDDIAEVTVALTAEGNAEITAKISHHLSSGGAAELTPGKPTKLEEGQGFGRYQIEDEVARGGMGAIYRVKDRDLSRTLALKVMLSSPRESGTSPDVTRANLARFVEEAQVTAQLDHPGIVPVHELGFDAQGRVYFTMKLVKGRELGEIFALARDEKDGWNLSRAVGVMVKACQALAYAHSKRVVHRDLKPANIMTGRFGEVYVMDWGLAKVAGKKDLHDIRLQNTTEMTYTSIRSERRAAAESNAESPLITMDGSVVGTPAYMPPEQAGGKVEEVDSSSDIYSLGAILYNLLTGQAPYVEPGTRISPHTILARVLDGPPKRVHAISAQAPPELVAICEKAMARDGKRRYGSSLDMAEDLQAYLDRRVVRAYRTGAIAEFRSWVVRNKGMAASAAAAAGLALCGLVAVFLVQLEARRDIEAERNIALDAQRREEKAKTLAQDALDEVTAERDLKNEALEQKSAALVEKDRALARAEGLFLTGRASQDVATNPGRALLLAVEGVERQGEVSALSNQVLLEALRADRELLILAGASQPVSEVVYSPDGKMIAGVQGGAVRLWDDGQETPVRILLDPSGDRLARIGFRPDGRRLAATAAGLPRVLIFDVAGGHPLHVLTGHEAHSANTIESIEFSPDGQRLVTAAKDGTARIYNVADGAPVRALAGHACSVLSATFSPDSKRVLTASGGYVREFRPGGGYLSRAKQFGTTARIWDAESGEELLRIGGHEGAVHVAAFSPDGRRIVTGSTAGVKLHDTATGAELPCPDLQGSRALWSPRGHLLTLGPDGFLRRWSVDPFTEDWSSRSPDSSRGGPPPAVSPDGRVLALRESQTTVGLRDLESGQLVKTLRGHGAPVMCLAFSPDGTRLLTGSDDGAVRVWSADLETRFSHLEPAENYRGARKTLFAPGGDRVLAVHTPNDTRVLDRASGREVARLAPPRSFSLQLFRRERFGSVFFQPKTRDVVTVAETGAVRIWGEAAAPPDRPSLLPTLARDLAPDPAGRYLAVAGGASGVLLLRYGSGEIVHRWWEDKVSFESLRFSPDGKTLFALGSDLTARLWAVPSGEEATRIDLKPILASDNGRGRAHADVLFDPSGTRLLLSLGSFDGELVMLDAATGMRIGALSGQWVGAADQIEFAPDGERILVVAGGRLLLVPSDLSGEPRGVGQRLTFSGATFGLGGQRIISLLSTGDVEARDARSLEIRYTLGNAARWVESMSVSDDGQQLLTGSSDGRLDLWDLESGRHVRTFGRHPAEVSLVSFSPDGRTALSLSDGYAYEWETASGEPLRTMTRNEFSPRAAVTEWVESETTTPSFSADGRRFAMLSSGLSAAVWDVESGKLLLDHRGERTRFGPSALGPKGERFFLARQDWAWLSPGPIDAVAGAGGRIRRGRPPSRIDVFDLESGARIASLQPAGMRLDARGDPLTIEPTESWRKIEPSGDGRYVAAVSYNAVVVWEIASGAEMFRSRSPRGLLEWSPDGRRLLFRDWRGLRTWDSETAEILEINPVLDDVTIAAFSPDGHQILFAGDSSAAELWSETSVSLRGHQGSITDAVFSSDGAWLATASLDKTVRVWKARTGAPWVVLPHDDPVTSLLFGRDGREILTVTSDRVAHAWPMDLLATARSRLTRSLTADERDLLGVGSALDRAKERSADELRRLLGALRLLADVSGRDASNARAASERARLATALRTVLLDLGEGAVDFEDELERTLELFEEYAVDAPEIVALRADRAEARGDLARAIAILEAAVRRGSPGHELARLEGLRERVLPDLVTLASIDAALDVRETIVPEGATWRYLKGTREPSEQLEWTEVEFDDTGWESGPSGFGYGDGDDTTLLEDMRNSYSTVYIRHVFERTDESERFHDVTLEVLADDGFVAYLNGVEVGRSLAGPTGTRLARDTLSTGESPEPLAPVVVKIPPDLIRTGRNVLTLQGLNRSLGSSDLTLLPVLTGGREPDLEGDRARFAAFRGAAKGDGAARRIDYLEARLLERAGKLAEAALEFQTLSRGDPALAEPNAGLVRCLGALGRFDEALRVVVSALAAGRFRDDELWDAWFEISLVRLGHTPEAALAYLERQDLDAIPGTRRGRELRWVLERLREGALRLNCGSEEYTSTDGVFWAGDRLFTSSGQSASPRVDAIAGTDDDALFWTERYFPRSSGEPAGHGYRIPLPPGRYRITLGFAEAFLEPPRFRRFDVFLEGERVLEDFVPKWVQAETHSFERAVMDGALDITFEHDVDNPKVSTIEVVPSR